MIRPFTCLCLAAAFGSGMYLYTEKHQTTMLDRQITNVVNQTQADRIRIGLLRAEWALLNEPGRLQEMADKYLALKPMAPTQFVQIADLASHLPAPQTAAEAEASDDQDTQAAPDTAPQPETAATIAGNGASEDLPARVLAPKPDAHNAAKLLAHLDLKPKTRTVSSTDHSYAQHNDALARGTPLPLATPQPVPHIYSALARPLQPQSYRPQIVSSPSAYAQPYVGSALGGRGSLPPPTPYGGEQ